MQLAPRYCSIRQLQETLPHMQHKHLEPVGHHERCTHQLSHVAGLCTCWASSSALDDTDVHAAIDALECSPQRSMSFLLHIVALAGCARSQLPPAPDGVRPRTFDREVYPLGYPWADFCTDARGGPNWRFVTTCNAGGVWSPLMAYTPVQPQGTGNVSACPPSGKLYCLLKEG